ncbi:MAPEG family protein [Undibacterium sp. CY7W]|uniref:MAPEG family protein n=1 Tax=Undibacterium rugosum TaxID=2762291 RepID=A0A923HZU9_9BURK|nr:MAPEG family protein [Undibacterium rugosum]MBC3933882.1 MAPEG family protein [Undibacterium rugosum]
MTFANWCVLAACLLPIATIGLAKVASARADQRELRYNNRHPRAWTDRLQGWQQRANAAQQNGWEALPLFIAAVVLAQQAHADQSHIDMLAAAFIVCRILYIAAYLANQATLRSLIWFAAGGCSVAILLLS